LGDDPEADLLVAHEVAELARAPLAIRCLGARTTLWDFSQ
jgi:hypothetical protein